MRLTSRPAYFSAIASSRMDARSLMDDVAGTRVMSTSTPFDSSTSRIPRQWEICRLCRVRWHRLVQLRQTLISLRGQTGRAEVVESEQTVAEDERVFG